MRPDTLRDFFARAAARMSLVAGARGIALALGAGLPLLALRWRGTLPVSSLLAALGIAVAVIAAMMIWRSPRRATDVAIEIEARTRAAKNLLITAAEIDDRRAPIRDDVRDVVRYWKLLNEGYDCVFGSRFMRGGGVIDYPASSFSSIVWPTAS